MANIFFDDEKEPIAHLPNGGESMCGGKYMLAMYQYTTGTPTCIHCIALAKQFILDAPAAEIESWK